MGLTGAWFSKSESNATGADNVANLKFGQVGPVSISADPMEWKAANGQDVSGGRTALMPGDRVKTGDIVLSYDASSAEATTEGTVYYLVSDGSANYYKVVTSGEPAVSKFEKITNGQADTIAQGTSKTIAGDVISIKIGGEWYALDGVTSGEATEGTLADPHHSYEIPVSAELTTLVSYNGENASVNGLIYSFNASGITYTMAVVQLTNMPSAAVAYDFLVGLITQGA